MYVNLKPNKHKRISFNTTTMASLGFTIVGPQLDGGGMGVVGFQQLSNLGVYKIFC